MGMWREAVRIGRSPWRSPMWEGARWGGSTAGGGRTHYEQLGVRKEATEREIKRRFYERAKALHPDRSTLDPAEAQRQFVVLLEAYQTLVAPLRRAAYDRDLDVAAALATDAGLRRWASDSERAEPTSGGEDRNDPADPSSAYALFVARHGITERTEWAAQLAREYNNALFRAYMGPRWTPTDARQFPCDFEAEQRSTPAEPDLLHLVSGRQLLGRVVLATASRTAPRLSPASSKSDTPPLEHAASDATELHFQGSCVARAHRVPVPGRGPDYYTLRVYLPASTAVVGTESGSGDGHDATMECRAQVHGIDRRGRWSVLAVSDAVGRVAYRVRLFGTLLVRHVVITNADGKSVAHIARARLPPRALWLWEARAQTHGRAGSWLFDLSDKDERYIHPAVPVLLAAYLSLDEEQRGPQGLARLGHWWRHR